MVRPLFIAGGRATLELLEQRKLLSFSAPVSYNIGTQSDTFVPNAAPINVVTGDFNGDGILDLVVSHRIENSVYFLAGNGDGTFHPAVTIAVGEAIEGREFVGDFNNDGKLDLLLPGDLNSANHPIVLLGNGNGTFQPRIDSSSFAVSGTYPRGWCVGDFNNDGKLDVACTLPSGSDSGGYIVLLGNGDGTFKPGIVGPLNALHYSRWSTAADLNGDGKLDLITADGQGVGNQTGTAELSVLLGNGDGTFKPAVHYPSPQTPSDENIVVNPEDVALGDVNHDGKLDAIESDYDHNINVFLGNGDGTFQAAQGIGDLEYPRDVAFTDVNGDGNVDLVVDNLGVGPGGSAFAQEGSVPGSISVLIGNGDGTFQPPIQYNSVFYPGWAAVGDFNGDTLPDVAVTQVSNGHSVNVMLNHPATASPTLVTPASATPSPLLVNSVSGSTVALSALGGASIGESSLTYTWSVTSKPSGSTTPTFSVNGNNAAKNTTATFTQAGLYTFLVTVANTQGSTNSSVQASVVVNQHPTVATAAAANPSTVTSGNTSALSVLGADDGGEDNLTYTWSTTGTPPAPVAFSINGTHDAKNTTATFTATGTYQVLVTITDANGLSVTSSVSVVVNFPSIVTGSSGNDTYVLRISPSNNQLLQLFINTPTTGSPTYSTNKSNVNGLNINSSGGDDTLTIDFANGDPLFPGGVSFDGGANVTSTGDSLLIEGSTGADGFSIDASHVIETATARAVTYANLEHVQFDLLGGDDVLTQNASPAAAVVFNGGSGNDTLNVNAGAFTFNSDAGATTANLSVNVPGGSVAFASLQHLSSLNLTSSGTAHVAAASSPLAPVVISLSSSLSIALGSTLDLANNELICGGVALSMVQSFLKNGQLFTSSSGALGYLDLGNGQTEVRYTLPGDTNLDGDVNVADLANLAANFGVTTGATWLEGDLDYNGSVNIADLAELAGNFGQSLGGAGGASRTAIPDTVNAASGSAGNVDAQTYLDGADANVTLKTNASSQGLSRAGSIVSDSSLCFHLICSSLPSSATPAIGWSASLFAEPSDLIESSFVGQPSATA
jgi:hypothetical protein